MQHYDQWESITNVRFDAINKKCYVQKQYDGNIVLHLNGSILCALLQAFRDLFLGLLAVYLSLLCCSCDGCTISGGAMYQHVCPN